MPWDKDQESSQPMSGPHLLKSDSSNEQHLGRAVQDLGTRPGQGQKLHFTPILVLHTRRRFHPHPPL